MNAWLPTFDITNIEATLPGLTYISLPGAIRVCVQSPVGGSSDWGNSHTITWDGSSLLGTESGQRRDWEKKNWGTVYGKVLDIFIWWCGVTRDILLFRTEQRRSMATLNNKAEWRICASVDTSSLVQIMAWRGLGTKPLSEPMLEYY